MGKTKAPREFREFREAENREKREQKRIGSGRIDQIKGSSPRESCERLGYSHAYIP